MSTRRLKDQLAESSLGKGSDVSRTSVAGASTAPLAERMASFQASKDASVDFWEGSRGRQIRAEQEGTFVVHVGKRQWSCPSCRGREFIGKPEVAFQCVGCGVWYEDK